LNLDEAFVDATFASAKKGALPSAPLVAARARRSPVAAGNSLPLAVAVQSASPAECQLVEEVLAASFLDELPARLIGDKAYDSDALDQKLAQEYDIELIAPNRQRRSQTQDGRKLRRYRRRWKVERLFAWMHLSSSRDPLGVSHRKLPRLCPTRLSSPVAEAFMRPLSRLFLITAVRSQ
jgi:Transposase DDE domain